MWKDIKFTYKLVFYRIDKLVKICIYPFLRVSGTSSQTEGPCKKKKKHGLHLSRPWHTMRDRLQCFLSGEGRKYGDVPCQEYVPGTSPRAISRRKRAIIPGFGCQPRFACWRRKAIWRMWRWQKCGGDHFISVTGLGCCCSGCLYGSDRRPEAPHYVLPLGSRITSDVQDRRSWKYLSLSFDWSQSISQSHCINWWLTSVQICTISIF